MRKTPEEILQTELATTVGIKPKPDTLCTANAEHDPANHPSHYIQGGVECKDAIRAAVTGLEGYEAFLTGNAIKYLCGGSGRTERRTCGRQRSGSGS